MYRWATKDHFEREQEETERLVRTSPKDKPPRRDLRRERVEPESDSDSADESDRKDRSKNYKTIGGSEFKVAADDRIPAKNRETGKAVYISPDTLKKEPGKYEVIDPNEAEGEDSYYARIGDALHGLARENPKLKNKLKDFFNPESHIFGFLKQNPDYPAAKLFPGVEFPDGVHSIGDIQKGLQNAGKELPKNPKKPKPAEEPAQQKAPETPKGEDAPGPEKEAPKGDDTPTADPKQGEPSEGTKPEKEKPPAIPLVKRRAVTEVERLEAASLISDTFSPEDAAKLLAQENLHPDDVKVLARDYLSAKEGRRVGNLAEFSEKVKSFYSEGFEGIEPPSKGRNEAGSLVPFEKLSDEEKAEATLSNQLKVMALSMAARDIVKDKLMDVRVLSGKPRIPEEVATRIAESMFQSNKEGAGAKAFDEFLASGTETPIDEKTAKNLLSRVGGSESGTAIAKAFLQANDYALAKRKYLRGDDETISEWQTPQEIVKGLKKASDFFTSRNAAYGFPEEHPAAGFFRLRVLQRLKALDPKKASAVTRILPALEAEEYQSKHKLWTKAHEGWEEAKARHAKDFEEWNERQKAHPKPKKSEDEAEREAYEKALKDWEEYHAAHPKPPKFSEPEPIEPPPPVSVPDKESGKKLWKDLFRSKKSSDSSYLFDHVMSASEKTAIYHGVDPYAYGPAEYQKWSQPHQRDMGSEDEKVILADAKQWLKSTLLTVSVEGMVPDAKYRAALDLAISSGPYNGQVQPTLYNKLLANLAGVSTEETLTTIREASTGYDLTTQGLTVSGLGTSVEALNKAVGEIKLSYKDFEGVAHTDGFATVRSVKASDKGLSVSLEFPKGSGAELFKSLQAKLNPLKVASEGKFSDSPVESIQRFASRVGDDKVAFEMLTYAQELKPETDSKYATLKAQIVKHAASMNPAQRKAFLPILKALKDLG